MSLRNKVSKLRLVVHISDKLRERLDAYIAEAVESGTHRRHGALSFVVEKAIKEFLDHEDSK